MYADFSRQANIRRCCHSTKHFEILEFQEIEQHLPLLVPFHQYDGGLDLQYLHGKVIKF